ncbi:MAG: MerC domain-containing protein [Candidatus Melainabacteria bacterium]|nr:MerC domain-containing protein [Candidatus Melainabacteria bacterium]
MAEHRNRFSAKLEESLAVLSIVAPIICLVDCLVIPAALVLLPAMGFHHVFHGISDQFFAIMVLLICGPVLIPGFLQHRKKRVLFLMALGFASIFLANFLSDRLDETLHLSLSVLGSACLIKANLDNKRLRKCGCKHGHG